MADTTAPIKQINQRVLEQWLDDNYPMLNAALRKSPGDLSYMVKKAMLRFGEFSEMRGRENAQGGDDGRR